MSKSCALCNYLKGFGDEIIINHFQEKISSGLKYEEFVQKCQSTSVNSSAAIPSKYYFNEHVKKCLKGLVVTENIKESEQKPSLEDKNLTIFKQKSPLDRVSYIQEIIFEVLYRQAHNLNNAKAKISKSDVDAIKSLLDIALSKYLDFSAIELTTNKDQLNNVSIDMLNQIFKTSLVNSNDILDIIKIALKTDLQKNIDFEEDFIGVEEKIEELRNTKEFLEFKANKKPNRS